MKITCQACEAKYTIADEKVQGKVAKMRCKKCGATIIVNGPGSTTGTSANPMTDASGAVYTVSVAEGDQRTMTLSEIVTAYNAGEIVGETYVWTDGMDDWLPLASIPAIVSTIEQASAPRPSLTEAASYASDATEGSGSSLGTSPGAVQQAARRDGVRGKVDLFGAAAMAGSENEGAGRSSRAPAQTTGGTNASLTGARNEQSVLFSLNSLGVTSGGGAPASSKNNDDSGLIDLGALARGGDANRAAPPAMQMAPVLGAPVLGAPMLEAPATVGSVPPAHKNKTGLYMLLGGGLVAAAIVAAALIVSSSKKDDGSPDSTRAAAPPTPVAPAVTEAPAPPPANTAVDPTESAASAAKPVAAPGGGGRRPAGGRPLAAQPAQNQGTQAAAPTPPPKPAGGSGNCGCPPGDLNCAIKCSASKK